MILCDNWKVVSDSDSDSDKKSELEDACSGDRVKYTVIGETFVTRHALSS